ncbi:hypothetical protein KBD08_02040 [Candidatus Babeliales bacterium]|nr:hypothetical protein [Candidatus Babeliales bacterium]
MKNVIFIVLSFFVATLRSADADSWQIIYHPEDKILPNSTVESTDVSKFFTSLFLHERREVHNLLRMGVQPTQIFKGFTAIGRLFAGMYASQAFVDPDTHALIEQRSYDASLTAYILNLLLKYGADPNIPSNYTLPTIQKPVVRPLDFVTTNKRENVAIVLALLQAGANPFCGSLCYYGRDLHEDMRRVFDAMHAFEGIDIPHDLYENPEGVLFMKKFWKACTGKTRPLFLELYRNPTKCCYFKHRYFENMYIKPISRDGVTFLHMITPKSK